VDGNNIDMIKFPCRLDSRAINCMRIERDQAELTGKYISANSLIVIIPFFLLLQRFGVGVLGPALLLFVVLLLSKQTSPRE
jgi:hypothetical protein